MNDNLQKSFQFFLVLLFVLLIVGTTLFTLLMICIIVTCSKKGRANQNTSVGPAINVLQRRISGAAGNRSNSSKMDKKAMIPDTSSEASEESEVVPYFRKVKK